MGTLTHIYTSSTIRCLLFIFLASLNPGAKLIVSNQPNNIDILYQKKCSYIEYVDTFRRYHIMDKNDQIFVIQDNNDPLKLSAEADELLLDMQLLFSSLLDICTNQGNGIHSSYLRVLRKYIQQLCKLYTKLSPGFIDKISLTTNSSWIFELRENLSAEEAFNWLYSSSIELKSLSNLAIENLFVDVNNEAYLGLLMSFNQQVSRFVYVIDRFTLNFKQAIFTH